MSHEREYIERHLGEPLTLALTDICLKRPRDPILYLGQWLLHWKRNKDQLLIRRRELEELLHERQKLMELQMEIEKEAQLKAEEEAEIGENVNGVDETGDEDHESKSSIDGMSSSQERLSFDRSMIEAHIPIDLPRQQSIIDRKLFQVTSPIFEIDEENIDDESVGKASKMENALRKESERRTSDRRNSQRRTSGKNKE